MPRIRLIGLPGLPYTSDASIRVNIFNSIMGESKVERLLSGFFFGVAGAFLLIIFGTDGMATDMMIVVMLGMGAIGAGFQGVWYDVEIWLKSKPEADSKKEPPY